MNQSIGTKKGNSHIFKSSSKNVLQITSAKNHGIAFVHYVQEIQWVEYFAGLGNLSSMMKASHYTSLRFDILDHKQESHMSSNYMDFTHSSGFGFLGTFYRVVLPTMETGF